MSTQFTNRQWRLPNNENKAKQSNYSMTFDGSSDYIDIGTISSLNTSQNFSISLWFNESVTSSNSQIFSSGTVASNLISISSKNGSLNIYIANSGYINIGSVSLNTWYHVVLTVDNTTAKVYINNGSATTNTVGSISSGSGNLAKIGDLSLVSGYFFNGKIDAVAVFDYVLTDGTGGTVNQIAALYGSSSTGIGNPMSLSTKPVAMYNLGDKSAFNGANYLVPNIAAEEADGDIATSYSPYALDFDGTNDYIDCGNDSSLNLTTEISLSAWVKTTDQDSTNNIIKKDDGASNKSWNLSWRGSSGGGSRLVFWNYSADGSYNYLYTTGTPASDFADGNWHHVVATYDGTTDTNGAKIYLDGVLMSQGFVYRAGTGLDTTTANVTIGNDLTASISNASIWNTALTSAQVTEIYNEGVPSNLNNHSAYSNLVSWWQLGSNSSYTNKWICLDEKGTNNGESVNMTEADLVDGVGSYANGLSSGMGGDEVIGDAPYSTANALSVNMDVEDRVTDTPS